MLGPGNVTVAACTDPLSATSVADATTEMASTIDPILVMIAFQIAMNPASLNFNSESRCRLGIKLPKKKKPAHLEALR